MTIDQKRRAVSNALAKLSVGAEEVTIPQLRNDLEQFGGTNDVTFIQGNANKGLVHIEKRHGTKTVPHIIEAVIAALGENGEVCAQSFLRNTSLRLVVLHWLPALIYSISDLRVFVKKIRKEMFHVKHRLRRSPIASLHPNKATLRRRLCLILSS